MSEPAVPTQPRSRTRASAKRAGAKFEDAVGRYLARHVDDRIERRTKGGRHDRGDLSGVRHLGERVVVEIKNTARVDLAGWTAQAETERGNDDAVAALVVSKRHGRAEPGDQWVHMTLRDLAALLTGTRPEEEP